jgi:predicted O-methyltransferase YrrM
MTVSQAIPDPAELKRSHFAVIAGDLREHPSAPMPEGDGAPNETTLSALYPESPYRDFDPEAHPDDLQGWNSYANVFRDVIEAVQPRRIVEVGVWKGTASIHMAKVVQELGLRCEVVCIDTWLGSPEHFLADHDGERYQSLRLTNGYPQLFYTFLANVVRQGVSDCVVPLPCTSDSAAIVLARLGLQADVIHVDAAHDYEAALRDFRAYWPLLSPRGVMIGDDYIAKRSVTRAADEFAAEVKRPLCGLFPKFVIARPGDVELGIVTR